MDESLEKDANCLYHSNTFPHSRKCLFSFGQTFVDINWAISHWLLNESDSLPPLSLSNTHTHAAFVLVTDPCPWFEVQSVSRTDLE